MPTNNLAPKAKNKLGYASSIPPNMAEQFGAAVSPYLQSVQGLFPPTNPYGQAMSNFLLGQAPQAAQQMAAGYPNVLFNTSNPLGGNRLVNPAALDMLGALPVATALKGAGLAKGGVAATFAGARARTADHAALALAEKMKAAGVADEEIHKATGWFFGSADGKPRFEIPDDQARLFINPAPDRLGNVYDHEELYGAYPDTQGLHYSANIDPMLFSPSGSFTNTLINGVQHGGQIKVKASGIRPAESTTLHEIQHAIQQREGFARGGSPEGLPEALQNDAKSLRKQARQLLDQGNRPEALALEKQARQLDSQIVWGTHAPQELYRRLAGESEARLTQARMDMTGPERAASYPPNMYDVPVSDQIVRYGEGPALATTWHGSPHLFPPTPLNDLGEFNAAKIGTGEGAQAYGHGHYTAEARGTGEGYQNRLSQGRPPSHEFKEITGHSLGEAGVKDLLPVTDLAGANAARAKSQWLAQYTAQELLDFAPVARQVTTNPGSGSLYKVDIPDEHIAKMLDWDKPLRQQPEEIRKILEKVAPSVKTVDTMSREELINTLQYIDRNGSYTDEMMINEFGRPATLDELRESAKMMDVDEYLAENMASDKHATGQSIYKQLVAKFGGGANQSTAAGQAKASELLQKAGIPGVRYLDAGSRGAEGGTSNFVVFPGNEHMMTILERNGQAMSPESQAIARYREVKGPKSVVRMEAALRTAGVPLPKNEPVTYIQRLVDRAHRRN